MNTLYDIFIAFFRTGLFGFGGGQAVIPLIQKEAVEKYGWLNIEEFTESIALSNSLPGPVTTKLAALIGHKIAGVPGMFAGIIGMILPSAILVIMFATLYTKYKCEDWAQGMMSAIKPVVFILVLQVVLLMGKTSFYNIQTVIIAVVAFALLTIFDLHPAIIIVMALIFGGVFLR